MRSIMEKAHGMRAAGLAFAAAFSCAFILLVSVYSSRFALRVKKLAERISCFEAGNWNGYDPISGHDEINILDKSFINMGARLNESIQRNYIQELEKKKAELALLHTQIRPHFLYNMLSAIAWIVSARPAAAARQAIENLAAFYRYSLSSGAEIITLGEELKITSVYVELQKLRFQGRISFVSHVDALLSEVKIPRMTLQPLVENSILHGAGDSQRPVAIALTASAEEDIAVLRLVDDGIGLDEETLERLQAGGAERAGAGGLGFHAVNERIRLYFGPPYGVTAGHAPGGGAMMTIRLPLMEDMEP
jgi:two-component system sensor histidine kinase YesM